MMKNLLTTLLLLAAFSGMHAQNWSATIKQSDGLPGTEEAYFGELYYQYKSPLFTPGEPTTRIRITVTSTITDEAPNGNNIIFALSELKVYDKDGNSLPYIATSNADHNSMSYIEDGDGLFALSDNDYQTYFHSMWTGNDPVTEHHYVEVSLAKSIDSFSLEWATRLGEPKNAPTTVGVTLGTDYNPSSIGDEFVLGDAVTTAQELKAEKQLFVLKSNAVKSFTASNGTTYSGSGPLYMRYAEEGDKEAATVNVMQLIPFDAEHYIIYWPVSGKYLANSASSYNGLNGWQYSTTSLSKAAYVKMTPVAGGKFELQYNGANSAGEISLYVGAEMRDGVDSKMKTFDLEHKTALENGDYTKGYSLPIDFGWEIYKAVLDDETVAELMLSLTDYARTTLQPVIDDANAYLTEYGNFDGDCNGEDTALRSAISNTANTIATAKSFSEIEASQSALLVALSEYMVIGLKKYERRVAELESNATYSSYPYTPGTYPESSKQILEDITTAIATAKASAGIFTAKQYESIFTQIESDIARFESSKVNDAGTGEEGDKNEEEDITEGDIIYVYLKNGNIDAYAKASLDGDYFIQNDKLYFPIKDGDTMYYTLEEYDSCSIVRPRLPQMTSFKFNNKYNPNLNVDAIAENVTDNMYFSLNAIGKWLTASFQLSDDKAVAYVDTVLQESKVTRQSFADKVTYKVTYPGYNIIERVKVQDELWTNPVANGDTIEVALTADMLSTNKPSQDSNESLANLLDNNPSTIFHSTWGTANNATINLNTYIDIALPEPLENVQLYYRCRPQSGYNPLVWEIYVSEDGNMWTLAHTLDYTKDNMPTGGAGQEYTSPTISLGGSYSKLRIIQTSGEYSKNHFVLSELRIHKVLEGTTEEPEKIQDAVYENRKKPFGREYDITVEWLTENAISVPRIDIDIEGRLPVTSKDYYLDANFRITGYGIYENFEDSVQIKGRGNSSWGGYGHKNPYRLKFAEKVKPFGLTKGKSWVLLANAQKRSLMANAMSMKIGQMAGAHYTNHIIPVDLYINGEYVGNYMFTEKVGMANNSVDIDEALGYLLELDTYGSSDEPITRTGVYNLPVKIAEPDLEDYTADVAIARKEAMIKDVREMSAVVYDGGDLETVLDVDALARFYLANDLSLNQEINHPKSTFLYKNESDPNGKLTFGPIWDFDWGYGYETNYTYYQTGATSSNIKPSMEAARFWEDVTNNEVFRKHYYKVWKEFLDKNSMEELEDYIDSYFNFAKNSFDSNVTRWGSSYGFNEDDRDRAKEWLKTRKNHIYNNLTEYDIDDLLHPLAGDVNCNDVVTVHDVALITAYLNDETHKAFHKGKADVDGDGSIGASDAEATANLVLNGDAPSPMYWYSTTTGIGAFGANDFELELGAETEIPLTISSSSEEKYSAMQFDVNIPDGMDVPDITIGNNIAQYNMKYTEKEMNNFRFVIYPDDNATFNTGEEIIVNLKVSTSSVIEEDARKITVSNIYVVDNNLDERRLDDIVLYFTQTTSIGSTYATYSVRGGECITVTVLEAQDIAVYSVDGRLVHKLNAKEGTSRIEVPQGVYIVNGEKVVVF